MSRTYKHTKQVRLKRYYKERWDSEHNKVAYEAQSYWDPNHIINGFYYLKKAGVKPKLRKAVDTEDHWMSTPSWWTKLCMIKPQRRAGRVWERRVLFEDIEETDAPGVSNKPHIYYW